MHIAAYNSYVTANDMVRIGNHKRNEKGGILREPGFDPGKQEENPGKQGNPVADDAGLGCANVQIVRAIVSDTGNSKAVIRIGSIIQENYLRRLRLMPLHSSCQVVHQQPRSPPPLTTVQTRTSDWCCYYCCYCVPQVPCVSLADTSRELCPSSCN